MFNKKLDSHLFCNVLWMSVSHTVGVGAVLTGGPARCCSGLLQLYQGSHHGRQSAGCLPSAGLPQADALLLVSGLRQRLFALWRWRTPEERSSVNHLKPSKILGAKTTSIKKKKLPPAGDGWRSVRRASSSWGLILGKVCLGCWKERWCPGAVWLINWRTWWLPASDVWLCLTFTGWQQKVGMVEKTAEREFLHLGTLNCSQNESARLLIDCLNC